MSENFVIPPDKATGCLPRASRVGEWCPKASDRIDVIPESEVMERIEIQQEYKRNLRHQIAKIGGAYDQDGVGSCACESGVGALKLCRAAEGQPFEQFNPWALYKRTGGRDNGRSIDSILRALETEGAIPEELWPRYDDRGDVIHKWTEAPPERLYDTDAPRYRIHEWWDVETWEEVRTCLLMGKPVVFGHDNHAEAAFESLDEDNFAVLGSWGDYKGYPRPFEIAGCHIMHRRDIEWKFGAFCPASAYDAGGV